MTRPIAAPLARAAAFVCLAASCFISRPVFADAFNVTYLDAGVQTPAGITSQYETFDSANANGGSYTTNFNNSGITGTYTGSFSILPADQYGGAGGTGQYIAAPGNAAYTLTLSSQVNYFGLWFSALDSGNTLSFYNNGTLLYTFTPDTFIQLVGGCPSGAPTPNFCGNPNLGYSADGYQQFAFLNVYDTTGTFNQIVFSEAPNSGSFESDNHAVALLDSGAQEQGTVVSTDLTPEPGSLLLLSTGVLAGAGVLRRRAARLA